MLHEDECYICGDGGELLMCDKGGCLKCYHKDCLGGDVTSRGKWICPWHFCDDCGKWANILCTECPNSYCKAHASGQITELGNGIHVCCDHIMTRKKTTQNHQTEEVEKDGGEAASAGIE
ncbi:Histone-lysine N-methyltransferase, H3 lysine-36 and H4 lysine-20 specific [Desmophyllum pertusum]|uniref:Histone-lysine N-methyltransferase, H3 lysine-36 and H4 lysine-20 specific n=1 Tax=Desmophyllum pertusum TaxID=174260 RepID=A0A9W9ZK21_9CNID|nr:Histone-lysine N-methyltransferase, H3 lysine-36 and H4 lysine-20 specific [Desmophyllum pertusum]